MKKLILAALTLLVLSPTVYSAPGGFNQSLNLFEEGTSPNLDKINSKNLEGGCYTEFSPVEFLQEFVVSFKKGDSSQYNLEFFDPKKK